MQGRLSSPTDGRIQSFPVETWREEFELAREAGLDCIEWIYETGTDVTNPLRTDAGLAEVRRLSEGSGIAVWSICADYFMVRRLVAPQRTPDDKNIRHLQWLLSRAGRLGARYVVLPFVDASSLKSPEEIEVLLAVLHEIAPAADQAGVEIHLETDLEAAALVELLEAAPHSMVRANYDIGNSASLGRAPLEELTLLRPWLGSVHVKDRMRGSITVPLGSGAADFQTCFQLIGAAGFAGPFILQAARCPELDEVELARRNRQFVGNQLDMLAYAEQ